jgi:HSP20 family protein
MAKFFSWEPWLGEVVSALNAPTAAHGVKRIVQFHPPTDVLETDEQLMIMVELPGLEREDITLEVHGNELIVYGERKLPESSGVFQIMERSYGCFSRKIVLPSVFDASSMEARMRAGLLTIIVSKASFADRRIEVLVEG